MENYLKLIKTELGYEITRFHQNEGQNNWIYEVNDEFIFRFPKFEEGKKLIRQERTLLAYLNETINYPIPKLIGHDQDFMVYKRLKGTPLRKEIFDSIKDQKKCAKSLALFLNQLHHLPIDHRLKLKEVDGYKQWSDFYNKIKSVIYPHLEQESIALIDHQFNQFLSRQDTYQKTIVHGDFGPSNILYDQSSGSISGIIDFSECCIDDPAIDIASLIGPFGYGEAFINDMMEYYPEINNYMERARFYASTFALQEALYGIIHHDQEAFQLGIAPYIKKER